MKQGTFVLNRMLFVLLISLSMVLDVRADIKRIAVLEFQGVGVQSAITLKLSDQARLAALDVLSREEYEVMTRENMMQVLNDMGKDTSCLEGVCEIDIGRNVGADVIVTGDILQIEGVYYLTLKLYETHRGTLLSGEDIEADTFGTLKANTFAQSKILFQKGLDISNPSSDRAVNIQSGFTGSEQSEDWDVLIVNTAIVEFTSSPSEAVVLVDGQIVCSKTPCSKEIQSGSHTVVFQKERYFPYESIINAKTGTKVTGEMEARFGYVSVSSSPSNVNVSLDGTLFGRTPIFRKEVDAGIHTLSIDDSCFVGPDYRFQMKPGGVEDVTYPVSERQSAVKVTVLDKGNVLRGDVLIDDKRVGQSSRTMKIPLCSKEVKVKVKGETYTKELMLTERQVHEILFEVSVLNSEEQSLATFQSGANFHVNINTADTNALIKLSGVGPYTAQKIIDYRTTNGDFKSCSDLTKVTGIGPILLEKITPHCTVRKSTN